MSDLLNAQTTELQQLFQPQFQTETKQSEELQKDQLLNVEETKF